MKQTKAGARFWAALVIFSLVGQIAWVVENMYFNVFIYEMFRASAEQISLMVAASAVAATLTTLLIGALSDRVGRRKPFICGGYILWGISIWSFALIREDLVSRLFPYAASTAAVCVTLTIVMDCVMTFFGSSANDACFNAWLTDATDEGNRGAAEGINAMMPLVAILAVFGGFMSFDLSRSESWQRIFTLIGVVVILIGAAGIFLIREPAGERGGDGYFRMIFYGFRPSVIRANPALYRTLAAFSVFGIAIQIFMPYLILYYTVTLGMENYVLIFAPAIVIAALATALWGRLYDRIGYRKTALPSLLMMAAGFVILFCFRATAPVFIGSLLMLTGYLTGMAVFGARIRDCTPAGKAGMFQGLRIVGQVMIPGVIGPAIGAAVLRNAEKHVNDDHTESFIPNRNIFLAALIVTVLLGVGMAIAFSLARKRGGSKQTDGEGTTDENDND